MTRKARALFFPVRRERNIHLGLFSMWVTLGFSLAVAIAAFLPWGVSGEAHRNSFELVRAAARLDVLDGAPQRIAAVLWYFVPLAAALAWIAAFLRKPRVVAVLAGLSGALTVGFAWFVHDSPVVADDGVACGFVVGGLAVVSAGITAWQTRGSGRERSAAA